MAMKILVVLFLVFLVLVSTLPVPSNDLALENAEDLDFLISYNLEAEDGDDAQIELGKRLREESNYPLEKPRETVEQRKCVKEVLIKKLKKIRAQMRDLNVDLGKKARDLLKDIKEKGYWQKLFYKLRLDKESRPVSDFEILFAQEDEDDNAPELKTKLEKNLRKHLDEILEEIRNAVDHGKTVQEEMLNKMWDIRQKFKELREDIIKRAKDLIDKIKEEGKNYFKQILEKLGLGKRVIDMHTEAFFMEAKDEGSKMQKKLEVLKNVVDAMENGQVIKNQYKEKLRELREKLKKISKDLGEKRKAMSEKLEKKVKNYLDRLMEKLRQKRDTNFDEFMRNLKEKILEKIDSDDVKSKIEEVFEKGNSSAKELSKNNSQNTTTPQELPQNYSQNTTISQELSQNYSQNSTKPPEPPQEQKDKSGQWQDKIRYFFEEKTRSIKETYEKIREYLENLRNDLEERFVKFGEWAKSQYEKGLEVAKEKVENLKNLAKKFIDDAENISKDVAKEAGNFFDNYKQELGDIYEDVHKKVKEILSGDKNKTRLF